METIDVKCCAFKVATYRLVFYNFHHVCCFGFLLIIVQTLYDDSAASEFIIRRSFPISEVPLISKTQFDIKHLNGN